DDGWKPVTAGAEQARCQIFSALVERRICVSDRAIVADVARNDRVLRQSRLDRPPGLARRHAVMVALARIRVPGRARIIVLVVHARESLQPTGLRRMDERLALVAA